MANEEQLNILKQGVEVWNQWREKHPNETIDLSRSNLSGADLREAILLGADLRGADLREATLFGADLRGADLREAKLYGTDLRKTNLRGANLCKANLREAKLYETYLCETRFCETNLRGANLCRTNLQGVNLCGVNLCKAFLREANLREANLSGADLNEVKLRGASLIKTNLSQAILTGAELYGTARDDWTIDGIKCNYVYWDAEGKERTPKDRDFRPGQFEERYKQLPTFDYYFEQGVSLLDIAFIDQIVNEIRELHPDWELKIDSIHSRGDPHSTFTIREKELIKQAFTQIKTRYEEALNRLGGRYEEANRCLSEAIKALASSGGISIDAKGDVTINVGGDVTGGNKTGGDIIKAEVKGNHQQVAIGKGIQQHITENKGKVTDISELNTQEELTAHYQLLSEKLAVLRKDYILETDTEVKFKLKKKIEEYEADLKQIEGRLEALENKEDNTQKA